MVPIIDGQLHHFGPRGLYYGLVLLGDDESRSYWDHITGECIYGPLQSKKMELFPIEHTSVKRALQRHPDLQIAISRPPLWMKLMAPIMERGRKRGFLPPMFRKTMSTVDAMLPEMYSGLGIITEHVQRFYPIDAINKAGGRITDQLEGRDIVISIDPEDRIPHAAYANAQNRENPPMQMFTRWYGFSLTYPDCEVFS